MEYTCQMHPDVRADKPGVCPKCGMKLEPKQEEKKLTKEPVREPVEETTKK